MTTHLAEGLRWQVLQALERAREKVARGYPTLRAALKHLRLSERAKMEVDRALDEVRFEVSAESLESIACGEGGKSAEGLRLRDDLKAARSNGHIPWESPEGLNREQTVCLLFIAREFLMRLPAVSAGPLLPSLPISE